MTRLYSAGNSDNFRLAREGDSKLANVPSAPPDTIFVLNAWTATFLYTKSGHWYGAGNNDKKILGNDIKSSKTYIPLPHFDSVVPKWADCADKYIAIVSTEGELFCCGDHYGGELKKIPIPEKIAFVSCGDTNMLAIPEENGLYTFTSDGPTKICPENKFVDCAVGKNHYLALSQDNILYSWGKGKQCGQGRKFSSSVPQPVDLSHLSLTRPIYRVFAYNETSFFLTQDSTVYAAGRNGSGQCGMGNSLVKSNTFFKVRTPDECITMITCGSDTSYLLTASGDVYACGESCNSLLMSSNNDNAKMFRKCDQVPEPVTFIEASTGHVTIASGMEPLPHPLARKGSIKSRPYYKEFTFASTSHLVDISNEGLNSFGFAPNDVIIRKPNNKKSTENKSDTKKEEKSEDSNNKKSHQEMTVLGISKGTDLVVTINGNPMLLESFDPHDAPIIFSVIKRPGIKTKQITGRSGNTYLININENDCLLWGVCPGEKVSSPLFGDGIVEGCHCDGLWITWDKDKASSAISDLDPIDIYSVLTITGPINRTLSQFTLSDGREIPGEVSPCTILQSYGFHVNDIVTVTSSKTVSSYYGKILGSFAHYAIIQPIENNSLQKQSDSDSDSNSDSNSKSEKKQSSIVLETFFSLSLIRSSVPYSTKKRAFGGGICDVQFCPEKGDKILPGDRIILRNKLGTVLGRDTKGDGFWINFDDALLINEGAVFVSTSETSQTIVISRINESDGLSENEKTNQTTNEQFVCGDIVTDNENRLYIAIERNESGKLVFSEIGNEKNEKNKKKITTDDNQNLVLVRRNIGRGRRTVQTIVGLDMIVDVSLERFIGLGMAPGDEVMTPEGHAIVAGILENNVWFNFPSKKGCGFLPPLILYSDLIKVTKRLSSNIILN